MNALIEVWQKTAKEVYDAETKYLNCFNKPEKERTYTYKYLAQKQIELLEESRPDKNKNVLDQMNELQKECYEYLKKVATTGKIL